MVDNAGILYAEDLRQFIKHSTNKKISGLTLEHIQGLGGSNVLPTSFVQEAYKLVKEAKGLYISDEVQTGFGRLGTHFWGVSSRNIKPDIIVMAKGIGNGIPLSAVATTREIADTLKQALWFNTYGGNPISAAVGMETLKIIDEEKLQENCLKIGN